MSSVTYVDENGRRVSAETAYLTLDILARSNLTVATGAHVERIVFDTVDSRTRAAGVQFADGKGRQFFVRAKREVVLS